MRTISGNEPINLEEARSYLRKITNEDDGLIVSLITAARELAEGVTGLCLIDSEYDHSTYSTYNELTLKPNVVEVESVEVWDGEEFEELEEDEFQIIDNTLYSNLIFEKIIRVVYTSTSAVNQNLKKIMLELVALWYDNRPEAEHLEDKIVKKLTAWRQWQVI